MKDKWGNASQAGDIREHPIHRWRGPPSPMGKATIRGYRYPRHNAFPAWGRQREGGFAAKKEANPASLRSAAPSKGRGSRSHSLLPMEGGAPKGRRLDGESGMKKRGERSSQVRCLRERPIHRCAVPLPQWGRLRYGDIAIPDTNPSPRED